MSYAVIDFETTGLMPERTDRVVEVGSCSPTTMVRSSMSGAR